MFKNTVNKNYKLVSELSESQIESDVSNYLGYITPFWSKRYRLKAVSEQQTGADKLFDRFVPIYLQFKVSEGLSPLSKSFSLLSPNRGLQKIRTFRKENNINSDPILYFKLRRKAKGASDFQHNILRKLHNPPIQYAFYVAPLTLSSKEYNDLLDVNIFQRLFNFHPFHYNDLSISSGDFKHELGLIPYLRSHVSVPPHEDVTSSDHYYSFTKGGTNIAWHSGTIIPDDYRLSTQLGNIFEQAYNERYMVSQNQYLDMIDSISQEYLFEDFDRQDSQSRILRFARYLKYEYNISLFFLGNV